MNTEENTGFELDTETVDNQLFKTKYPSECEKLPLKYLEDDEIVLVKKCMDKEPLNNKEKEAVKELLARYRPYMKKYDSTQLEKNIDTNLNVIKTSDELLRLLNNPNRFRIDMNYNIDGEIFRLKLKIKQLPDSDYINLLDAQTKIFKELNESEKRVYAKATNGQKLNPEEMKMQRHIQDIINEKTMDFNGNAKDITEILAKIVDFVDDPEKPYIEKLEFWKQIDLPTRILLFQKIQDKLNIGEKTLDNLFPPIG